MYGLVKIRLRDVNQTVISWLLVLALCIELLPSYLTESIVHKSKLCTPYDTRQSCHFVPLFELSIPSSLVNFCLNKFVKLLTKLVG